MKSLLLALLLAVACHRQGPVLLAGGTAPPPTPAARPAARAPVGVRKLPLPDGGRRLAVTIWYPAAEDAVETTISWDGIFPGSAAEDAPLLGTSQRFPLLLLSHGSGGDGSNLVWLAEALASHGYVAAAVDHPGDRLGDYSVEGRLAVWRRAQDVTDSLTRLLADPTFGPRIDRRRIAAAGHSSGGLTVLLLAGARFRPEAYLASCRGKNVGPDCAMVSGVDTTKLPEVAAASTSHRDRRIRAVVAMAPVMGPGVTAASLRSIAIPVLVFGSPTDELVPFRTNAASYARRIPRARLVTIPDAGHMVFMPVCSEPGPIVAAEVCNDRIPAVDRAAVHATAIEQTIPFLDRALGVPAHGPSIKAAARP